MSKINSNVSSLIAQTNLARSNDDLRVRLERLSTGLQINRGADNPAGLIVSERLRSEISAFAQAIDNGERSINMIATAEGALEEVSNLLTTIKGLTIEAANTGAFSTEEIRANQLQIDSAVSSITRISNNTSFAGLKMLNGSLDYLTSDVDPNDIQDLKIFGVNFGTASGIPVNVEVLNSAELAQLFVSGNTTGFAGVLQSSLTIEVAGTVGTEVFKFVSGTTLSAVVEAVNRVSDSTGVNASLASATDQSSGFVLTSSTFGSDAFVSIRKIANGAFFQTFDQQAGTATNRDTGEDVLALVNGNLALGEGTKVSTRTSTIDLELNLTAPAAQTLGTSTFTIIGGGANFQIGPFINSSQQIGFGIQSVNASRLGDEIVGFLNTIVTGEDNSLVNGRAREASEIIDSASDQVSILRGRFGAFERNTLQTTIRSQEIAMQNLTASESRIRDTDFARETSELARAQVLVNAGTSTLAIANNTPETVLALLR